jgi:hypothetical protein
MTHIPTNLCFVLAESPRKKPVVWRKSLLSRCGRPCRALLPCGQPPACFCWQRVSLRHQCGRTTSSGTDFLTQFSGRMVDLTKVYWIYTTFRRRTAWIPEVCSVGLAEAYPETDRAGAACMRVQSGAPSARAAAGTHVTRQQLGSIGYQAHTTTWSVFSKFAS